MIFYNSIARGKYTSFQKPMLTKPFEALLGKLNLTEENLANILDFNIEDLFTYDKDRVKHVAIIGKEIKALGIRTNFRAPHHLTYLGDKLCIEVWPNTRSKVDTSLTNYAALKSITDVIKVARSTTSSIYVFDYDNQPPNNYLIRRATFALGRWPYYNYLNENCESLVNWIFTNAGTGYSDQCSVSTLNEREPYIEDPTIITFWNKILIGGYATLQTIRSAGVNATLFRGGKRRKTIKKFRRRSIKRSKSSRVK